MPNLGLYYYKARFYSAGLGRFLQTDPIGVSDGLNLYGYVGNSPLNLTDPSGLIAADAQMLAGKLGDAVSNFVSNLDASGTLDQFGRKLASDFVHNQAGTGGAQGWMADVLSPYAEGYDGSTANGQLAAAGLLGASLLGPAGPVKGLPAIKAGSSGGETAGKYFSEAVRDAAKAENPLNLCVFCRREGTGVQVDHAVPRSKGGNATLDNAQLACKHCNPSKGARVFPVNPPPGYRGKWPP